MTNPLQHWNWLSGIRSRSANAAIAVAVLLLVVASQSALSQTVVTLYSFTGTAGDGYFPGARLIRDGAGNLYGTTEFGGAFGNGTVFKLDAQGTETILLSFDGANGQYPVTGLIRDGVGNLYGTTFYGGTYGDGTVFKLSKTGAETVLYSFSGGADGRSPAAGLIRDGAGNLYGTTEFGGAFGNGTVFKLDAQGTETVLHSFAGQPDGAAPVADLMRDAAGNLNGTTYLGGVANLGTVFKLSKTGTETVLHSFTGQPDGAQPQAGLIGDGVGNLYGTTSAGGAYKRGTVFKLDTTNTETVLHSFRGKPDGRNPYGDLVRDAEGNLYGTTNIGGTSFIGTVFRVRATGREIVLHSFTGPDGAQPQAGLILGADGNLYGTAIFGGAFGYGTVFKLTP
jgi:uncharacterized repeat protein (TIGR03803 family)